MVVGIHSRDSDLVVNPIKNKKLTYVRASGKDENVLLTPPVELTLEFAIEFIEDDELVKVMPKTIRIRKRHLTKTNAGAQCAPPPSRNLPSVARVLPRSLAFAAAALGVWGSALAQNFLVPGKWFAAEVGAARPVKRNDVLAQMAQRRIVLLGETHDDADHRAWQLATLGALQLLRPRMVIGFEAFPRRAQPVLDKWIAGDLSERQLLEQTGWEQVGAGQRTCICPFFALPASTASRFGH